MVEQYELWVWRYRHGGVLMINTRDPRYKGNWRNVRGGCMLCEMAKRTEWHLETKDWVIAEKLGGGPFVVYKKHTDSLSNDEWAQMEHVVGVVFDNFDIRVMMNLVEDHWHGHIVTDEEVNLSDE